jgi:hypothetical protein
LVFEIELSFQKGKVRIGNGVFEISESKPSPHYSRIRSLSRTVDHFGPTAYFSEMIREAVSLVRNPIRMPISSGADGLRAVEVIQQIIKSSKNIFNRF